jgi:hypothetical protein
MRLLQVRGLLDGAPWFDVSQPRLLTPEGGAMHWSRIPDLALAGLMLIARPFLGPQAAEVFAVIAWPAFLLTALCGLTLTLIRRFGGGVMACIMGLLTLATFAPIFQFWPGRIDHHGLNAVLTLAGLAALTWPARPRLGGALAALCAVAMTSIAIEALPMAAGLIAGAGLIWLVEGSARPEPGPKPRTWGFTRLSAFGLTLAHAGVLLALIDAPGWGPQRAACDAYGHAHILAFILSGLALAVLPSLPLRTPTQRLFAGLGAGTLVIAILALTPHGCLSDPYAAVSDIVVENWLSRVSEAHSLVQKFQTAPAVALFYIGPPLAALIALALLMRSASKAQLMPLATLALMLALALVVTVWQVRAMLFAQTLMLIPAGLAAERLIARWQRAGGVPALLTAAAGLALLSPLAWWSAADAAFPVSPPPALTANTSTGTNTATPLGQRLEACQDKAVLATLNALPPARLMTPIDLGAPILAHTHHAVFSAPYHRNLLGLEAAIRVWTAPPPEAIARLRAMGATHILICEGLPETESDAARFPGSLSEALLAHSTPEGLTPVPLPADHGLTLFAIDAE